MDAHVEIECRRATSAEREDLLSMMRHELASSIDRIMTFMGITWPQFEQLYGSRGEVRAVRVDGKAAGYCWIELRGRELHIHAIFVLPERRGRGIGRAMLRHLEAEFHDKVDLIELGVETGNAIAKSLYAREGFVVAHTLPDIGFEIMRKPVHGEPACQQDGVP